jgi:hypothetical protein
VATLSYAYAESAVWLEELAAESHPMTHDLCRLHADAVKVPRGWDLNDVRSPPPGRSEMEPPGAAHRDQVANGAGLRLVGA